MFPKILNYCSSKQLPSPSPFLSPDSVGKCCAVNKFLISRCISPYLAAAPSSERLTLFGGSRARLVRTPQAEKHISVLFESSSVTTNWCTEGERGRGRRKMTVRGRGRRQSRSKIRRLQSPESAGLFILSVAGLADKSSLNMTQQYPEVRTVLDILHLGTSL